MLRLRDISIRHKLMLIIMLISGISLLLSCLAIVTYDWVSTRDSLARRLQTMALMVGSNSTAALTFDIVRDAEETLSALRATPQVETACIYDLSGEPFAAYVRDGGDFSPPSPEGATYRYEEDRLIVFEPIVLDGEQIGTVYLQSDVRELDLRRRRYVGLTVVFLVASSLVALALAARLRSVISEPILNLVDTMRRVSQDKAYSLRAEKHSHDELGQLIDGFNEMLSQIETRDAALTQAQNELERRAQALQVELGERKRAEERITRSLREKEVLLQEIHHRVKNNLQVISSLLELQRQHVDDERTTEMLRDSQNRVRSMALVHERLYRTEDLAEIDFREYVEDLCRRLLGSYAADRQGIDLVTEVVDVSLDIATAIPTGLIINELVSNSLKYAFPGEATGSIQVSLRPTGDASWRLRVADDGIGLPDGFEHRTPSSLGLKLVHALVQQLHGELVLQDVDGTSFVITFPAKRNDT